MSTNVIADNRPGAGGSLSTRLLINSKPDGLTIGLCTFSTVVLNPLLSPSVLFDPLKDLTPLSMATSSPFVLLTNPSFPARTVKELIDAAKAKPGSINYASAGLGTGGHLSAEMFRSMADIQATHVAYKGSGPANIALLSGEVHMVFESIGSSLSSIASRRLIALGVTTLNRSSLLPQIPTIAESGVPGYEVNSWQGVCAPGGTSGDLVAGLNRVIVQSLRDPKTVETFSKVGVEATPSSPSEFVAFLQAETTRWAKVIHQIGAKQQ
ncbi:MAG: tripartite tricarboxylate transporter substrate binding protein [Burkholderiales bacterium]|nr:tripartite tricarboxylate transporter substrate binding protein [Burkholderiales bacterium]